MGRQETLNTLVRGAGYASIGIVFSKVMAYFYRAVVARIGPEAYGQLSLGITVMSIFGTLSIFALNQAIKKYVAEHSSEGDFASVKGTVLSALSVTLPLSLVAAAIMFFGAEFIAVGIFESQGLVPIIKVMAVAVPFANLSKVSVSTITAYKKIKYRVMLNSFLTNIVQLLATLALIYLGFGVIGAAWGWALGFIAIALAAFYVMERKVGPVVTSKTGAEFHHRELLTFSYPLVLSGIIGTVLGWTDTIFLGYFMEESTVGYYNAALPTAMLMMIPMKAFGELALPSFSEISDDTERLKKVLKSLTRWTTIATLPMFMAMALFAPEVLHLLFGQPYVKAATVLTLLSFGYLYSASVGHLSAILKSVSETKILFKNSVFNLFLNTVLNLVLIPEWGLGLGMLGAAIATTTSILVMNTILVGEVYHFRKFTPFNRRVWKPIAASIPALLATYLLLNLFFPVVTPVWAMIPGGAFYAGLYGLTFLALGGLEPEDRQSLKNIGEKLGHEEKAEELLQVTDKISVL